MSVASCPFVMPGKTAKTAEFHVEEASMMMGTDGSHETGYGGDSVRGNDFCHDAVACGVPASKSGRRAGRFVRAKGRRRLHLIIIWCPKVASYASIPTGARHISVFPIMLVLCGMLSGLNILGCKSWRTSGWMIWLRHWQCVRQRTLPAWQLTWPPLCVSI